MFEKIKAFLFKNSTTKQTVAKNTFWLSVSNFGGRLIKAIIIIYAARVLGTDGYGVFSYAITLAGFLTLFMDPGINGILIRDASKVDDEERRTIFGTMFVMKIVLLLLGVAVILFIAPLFTTLPGAKVLIPIVALVLALDTLREFFFSLIRAMENMQWEAAIFLLTNVGIVVFGFIFLAYAANAKSFSWGYVAGDAIGTVAAMIALRGYFKKIFTRFDAKRVMPILKAAWPFAISGALGMLFTSSDILIISWMRSASDVGIYSAAIRIIQTFYLIPSIIQFENNPPIAAAPPRFGWHVQAPHHDAAGRLGRLIDDRDMILPVIFEIPQVVQPLIRRDANLIIPRPPRHDRNLTTDHRSAAFA